MEHRFYYAAVLILLSAVYVHFEPAILSFMKTPLDEKKVSTSSTLLLTFAVAPAILTYVLFDLKNWGLLGLVPVLLFPIASLHQLSTMHSLNHKPWFPLLPLSYSGASLAFFALILQQSLSLKFLPYLLMIIFSYLMIRPKK